MALIKNLLPSNPPSRAFPIDQNLVFCLNQTVGASGYVSSGGNLQIPIGPGRIDGSLILNVTNFKVSAGNETAAVFLLGSNDPSFANGNCDTLFTHGFAAASSGRLLPNICAATPAIPAPGETATQFAVQYSNLMGNYVFQYLQLYLLMGGTAPSISLSAWLSTQFGAEQ